jgi:ER membrane protein complex subunit 1
MGDRSTLYKYLNPNVVGVITSTMDTELASSTIYLMDTVTGAVLFRAPIQNSSGVIHACLTENWLVYHYFEDVRDASPESAKGYRIVTVELYEGNGKDDKTSRHVLAFLQLLT